MGHRRSCALGENRDNQLPVEPIRLNRRLTILISEMCVMVAC
jgi:hypothetical protein